MIKIEHLTKYFDGQKVLDDINLELKEGEFFCLVGSSGQGKSVFLQHLIGLLKPDAGSISIDGVDIVKLREEKLLEIRRKFGYLFQEGALFDYMSVYDNLALRIREHTQMNEDEINDLITAALDEVELRDKDVKAKFPSQLSGGMKKRVGIARAIILKPKILFYDEPTSGLDPYTGKAISKLILKICRELKTLTVVVSHDVATFFPIADRIAVIEKGSIIAVGTKQEIENSSDPNVKRLLLRSWVVFKGGL
jgi:phospholipid/cholesterol/gamma-HCH transport system ATP-binding protein